MKVEHSHSSAIEKLKSEIFDSELPKADIQFHLFYYAGIQNNKSQWIATSNVSSPEILEKAKIEGKLAFFHPFNESVELKISEELKKELERKGVRHDVIDIVDAEGVSETFHIQKISKLSAADHAHLDTVIKTQIVFLREQQNIQAEQEEKESKTEEKKVSALETKKATPKKVVEEAALQKIANAVAKIFLHATLEEARKSEDARKAEEKYFERKHLVVLKSIERWNMLLELIANQAVQGENLKLDNKKTWKAPSPESKSTVSGANVPARPKRSKRR